MQLRRFEGKTLKEALEQVKRDLGPEALILSSRTFRKDHGILGLLGGRRVEVMAAVDSPAVREEREVSAPEARVVESPVEPARTFSLESILPEPPVDEPLSDPFVPILKELGFAPLVREVYRRFIEAGVSRHTAFRLTKAMHEELGGERKPSAALQRALSRYVRTVEPGTLPRVVVLVGPTGVGKTTTLAKLAARDRLSGERRVALVSLDNYRIAAMEQLRVYADILNVPLQGVSVPEKLPHLLSRMTEFDRIYVDTAGMGPADPDRREELVRALEGCSGLHVMLLLNAGMNGRDACRFLEWFQPFRTASLTLTKMDETLLVGSVLNYLCQRDIPLSYLTTGQKVPDDVEPATHSIFLKYLFSRNGGRRQEA